MDLHTALNVLTVVNHSAEAVTKVSIAASTAGIATSIASFGVGTLMYATGGAVYAYKALTSERESQKEKIQAYQAIGKVYDQKTIDISDVTLKSKEIASEFVEIIPM